jgi:hypothetical protein
MVISIHSSYGLIGSKDPNAVACKIDEYAEEGGGEFAD